MVERSPRVGRDLERAVVPRRRAGRSCCRRRRGRRDALRAREAELDFDDPINIQYTSGHDRLPEGRDALAPQHPQQRLLRRRGAAATPRPTAICIPVPFYHCFGMVHGQPRGTSPRRLHRDPGAGVRARARRSRPSRTSAARRSTACRRCSSPSSADPRFADFDLSSLRTGIMAGSPCPVEVMKRVHRPRCTWPR